VQGNGNGFQITASADTTARTLYVYVSGTDSSGKLIAHLSDGSVPDYASSLSGAGQYNAVYTIIYAAASAGQQLVISWNQTSNTGNVVLQAAALGAAVPAPLPPTGVSASDGTAASVAVQWSASINATGYSVYRSAAAGTLGTLLGVSSTTAFTDSTAIPGTVYYYSVKASGLGGTSAASAQDAGNAAAPPSPPASFSASDGSAPTSVTLKWASVAGATTYTVYRSTSSGTLGAAIGNTNLTTFVDSTVVPGTVYYYAAVATGPGGSSAPSLQDSGFATTGASLAGVGTSSFAPINLTANGTSDWAKWPNPITRRPAERRSPTTPRSAPHRY